MKNDKKPISRKEAIVVQEVDGEVLIYDLKEDKAFCLNETSKLVWQACDGKRTIAEISDFLGQQFKSQSDEGIVWLALDQLSKENLLENGSEIENKFESLSRREAVRRLGMASLIALPIIASLDITAEAGQSGTVCGVACNSNSDCRAPCPTCGPVTPNVGRTCT